MDSELVVFGSQSQLEMVVLNLLNNSIDSLESFDGMRSIVISSFTENEKINLSVADSGVGVPIESQERFLNCSLQRKMMAWDLACG